MGDKFLNICLLSGLIICVGAWYAMTRYGELFFHSSPAAPNWPEAETIESVDHLSIFSGSVKIGLLKQDGHWIMTAPFSAAVDQSVVKRFLDVVSDVRPYDLVTPAELKRREITMEMLNLENPTIKVCLEGGGRRFEFAAGGLSQQGQCFYVQDCKTRIVGVFPARLYHSIPQDVDAVRSRRIIDCQPESITTLEVRRSGAPFVRMEKQSGTWMFVEPIKEAADGAKINDVLLALYTNRIERFAWPVVSNVLDAVDSESIFRARLPIWGVSGEAGISLRLTHERSAQPISLVIGAVAEGPSPCTYVLLPDGESVGTVSVLLKDIIDGGRVKWRNRRLFSQNATEVESLQISFPGEAMKISRSDVGQWNIVSPSADFADQTEVGDFVEKLLSMESLPAEGSDFHKLQSGPEICRIELVFAKAKRTLVICSTSKSDLMKITFDGVQDGWFVSKTAIPKVLDSFSGLLSFYDKTVLSLPINGIKRITRIVSGAEPETAIRTPNGGWVANKEDVTRRVGPQVELLSSLKSTAVSKPVFTLDDLDSFGLRNPRLEILIDVDASDAVRRTLHIGNPDGNGNRYAIIGGNEALFLISEKDVRILEEGWLQLSPDN